MTPGAKVIIDGHIRGTVLSVAQAGSIIVDVGHAIMSVNSERVVLVA